MSTTVRDLAELEPAAKAAVGAHVVLRSERESSWAARHGVCGGAVVLSRRRNFRASWRYLLECQCESRCELSGRQFELAERTDGVHRGTIAPSRHQAGPHGCWHCGGFVNLCWEAQRCVNVMTSR